MDYFFLAPVKIRFTLPERKLKGISDYELQRLIIARQLLQKYGL